MKKAWKEFKPNSAFTGATKAWQMLILEKDDEEIYANIYEYKRGNSYGLDIQIPEDLSITGVTTNIKSFVYHKLQFGLIEKHAKKIIKQLI